MRKSNNTLPEQNMLADNMSDAELRRQLIAHGETSIGPITNTTRAIYRKKLNHLKAAERKVAKGRGKAQTGGKLTVLSSDSEAEVEPVEPARAQKSRAARGKGRTSTRTSAAQSPPAPVVKASPRRSLRISRSVSEAEQHDSTEEDDEYEEQDKSTAFSKPIFNLSRSRAGPAMASTSLQVSMNNTLGLSRYDQPDSIEVSDSDFDAANDSQDEVRSDGPSTSRVAMATNTSARSDDSSFFNKTWSRWMGNGEEGKLPRPQSTSTPEAGRLLRHRASLGTSPQTNLPATRNRSMHSDTNFAHNNVSNNSRNHHKPRPSRHREHDQLSEDEMEREFPTEEVVTSSTNALYISKVLVLIVALFFFGLALVYLTITGPVGNSSNDRWLIEGGRAANDKGEWYSKEKIENARQLITDMYDILSVKAGDYECGYVDDNRMTINHLKNIFKEKYGRNKFGVITDKEFSLTIAMKHIIENQHWSIRLLDANGDETNDTSEVNFFVSDTASLSLLCRFERSALKILNWLFLAVTVFIGVVLLVTFAKWWKKQKEEEAQRVYEIVEQIIDILKSHSDACQTKDQEPFLAIPHVRDMLIPPKERRKMQGLWDKAVEFLSANESRIRVETQKISGEEFEVWRWLPASANGGKVWQGQAFGENKESGINYPTYSLTPCLKIRNMFDADVECDDDWHVRIQDAILEKCPPDSGILHVAVDKNSKEGCVYVKCLTAEHAGKCYKALHGWWFDGSLVTVKYLRLERYHQRFPHAERAIRPLIPSNNERRSLSQPFHRSIIESS